MKRSDIIMKNHIIFISILLVSVLIDGCATHYITNQSNHSSSTPAPSLPSKINDTILLPSNIQLYQNTSLVGGLDHITIMAKVTDALNRPVADGTEITFQINQSPWSPEKDGSLSTNDSNQNMQSITVKTQGGWANVSYGWIKWKYQGKGSMITATCTKYPEINNSIIVYSYYAITSWLIDDTGVGIGGTNVTLHAVGNDGKDVYTLTDTTNLQEPYMGLFTFNRILLYPNISYLYASAEVSYQKGVAIIGRSHNNISAGGMRNGTEYLEPIILTIPYPDSILVTANPNDISRGHTSIITAQLMLNGSPYTRSGFNVNFSSDNSDIGYLLQKNCTTDANGRAQVTFASNYNIGEVNITACFNGPYSNYNLTDTCTIRVEI